MRFAIRLALYSFLFQALVAQEENAILDGQTARVIGRVFDGSPSSPPAPKELPDLEVLGTRVTQDNGRTITMTKVADPKLSGPPAPRELTVEEVAEIEAYKGSEEFKLLQKSYIAHEFCFVSATVFDERVTRVKWWHKGESFVAWSNFDWEVMAGFNEFEGRGQQFYLIMGVGGASTKTRQEREPEFSLPVLPDLGVEGPKYTLVEGDQENEVAMRFMDVLHDLYEVEGPRLRDACLLREKHWKEHDEWLKENPPEPEDVVIHSWEIEEPSTEKEEDQ